MFKGQTPEEYAEMIRKYEQSIQDVLNSTPQPITTEREYYATLTDRLLLIESREFESAGYANHPVFKVLSQHIANWENQ